MVSGAWSENRCDKSMASASAVAVAVAVAVAASAGVARW
jgi:hypothetical protein